VNAFESPEIVRSSIWAAHLAQPQRNNSTATGHTAACREEDPTTMHLHDGPLSPTSQMIFEQVLMN
jgi:hypothetical protein